jgi:hypothetical protein
VRPFRKQTLAHSRWAGGSCTFRLSIDSAFCVSKEGDHGTCNSSRPPGGLKLR